MLDPRATTPIEAKDDLRARLAARLDPWNGIASEALSDRELNPSFHVRSDGLRAAAVLVGLIERPHGVGVLLTRRADTLRQHTGQIAFPGGGIDEGEAPWQAALREAEEEVGLHRRHVELIGMSTPFKSGSGFHVTPIVGLVQPGFTLTVSPGEVAEVFETPFDHLMDSANHARELKDFGGESRWVHAIEHEGRRIWGLTAAIIKTLHDRLYGDAA